MVNLFMLIQHNYLSLTRKKSFLTQSDIAFVMKLPDYANVSRWENGQREPSLEALLLFELLFDTPIAVLFERLKCELVPILAERIMTRIQQLKESPSDSTTPKRIDYLHVAFTRLASLNV